MIRAYQKHVNSVVDSLSSHLDKYAAQNSFDSKQGYKSFKFFESALKNLPHHLLTEDEIIRAYCEYVVGGAREGESDAQVRQAALAVINVTDNLPAWISYTWGQ